MFWPGSIGSIAVSLVLMLLQLHYSSCCSGGLSCWHQLCLLRSNLYRCLCLYSLSFCLSSLSVPLLFSQEVSTRKSLPSPDLPLPPLPPPAAPPVLPVQGGVLRSPLALLRVAPYSEAVRHEERLVERLSPGRDLRPVAVAVTHRRPDQKKLNFFLESIILYKYN